MTWNKDILNSMPTETPIIPSGDERIERYREDTMYRGSPDAVLVARDEKEAGDALFFCNKNKVPITYCGSQTSMTGASVPNEGLLVSLEKLSGIVDIGKSDGEDVVVVRPGTIVAELQKEVSDAGFFYPVAPTSRDECRIGSNVSTNATGEDSFKYGPVRNYVKEIEFVLPNGEKKTLKREKNEKPSWERNKAGYFVDWKNPLDLVIGSEGTLGFISRVTLGLLPKTRDFFSGLIPLPSNDKALDFVVAVSSGRTILKPRTLELVDSGALEMMKTAESFPKVPEEFKAFIYMKQEYSSEDEMYDLISKWYDVSIAFCGKDLAGKSLIALEYGHKEEFRLWRHRVPESANEIGRKYWPVGGGKIGSDWWVPIDKIKEMMTFFYAEAEKTKLIHMGYAHIGSGHPHTNIISTNPEEKRLAHDVLIKCCKKAVSLGGGVAGEHGVGKIHTDFLPIQHSPAVIEKMKEWKKEYDPNWILGRGNIFTDY